MLSDLWDPEFKKNRNSSPNLNSNAEVIVESSFVVDYCGIVARGGTNVCWLPLPMYLHPHKRIYFFIIWADTSEKGPYLINNIWKHIMNNMT
jgi:hypothetical protein